jgi:seryl-tRNA synthetase
LQSPSAIAEALKLSGIENVWDRIAPNQAHRRALLDEFNKLVKRRNQISHEGDREQSRRSGKRLRPINRMTVKAWIDYVEDLVDKVEAAFP